MVPRVKDYYKILGVTPEATEDQIKLAFHNVAKNFQDGADPRAKALVEAYEILANPKKRAQYDRYMSGQINTQELENNPETAANEKATNGNAIKSLGQPAPSVTTNLDSIMKWEYLTLESSHNYGTTKYYINGELNSDMRNAVFATVINGFGTEGWELIGIGPSEHGSIYIFKRPVIK